MLGVRGGQGGAGQVRLAMGRPSANTLEVHPLTHHRFLGVTDVAEKKARAAAAAAASVWVAGAGAAAAAGSGLIEAGPGEARAGEGGAAQAGASQVG